ncbi:lipoprotein, partial [Enterobacter cancerogenus]
MRKLLILCSLLLTGCDGGNAPLVFKKDNSMGSLSNINARLAFSCQHEILPNPDAAADILFKYARWLQKNNNLKQDKSVDLDVARLYRIAAENGHAKANINLQNGSLRGQFGLTATERQRFSQQLIDAGVASGYYFIAIYLQHGAAGLKQDEDMALRYYR